jgi:hypothetical protein
VLLLLLLFLLPLQCVMYCLLYVASAVISSQPASCFFVGWDLSPLRSLLQVP